MKPSNEYGTDVALLDSGNTRLKIGLLNTTSNKRSDKVLAIKELHTKTITTWFKEQNVVPNYAIGVNVASSTRRQEIENIFKNIYGIKVHWVYSQAHTSNVLNTYSQPKQLGSDRWVSMLGLSQHSKQLNKPLLLASFGTATTIDTLVPVNLKDSNNHTHIPSGIKWIFDGGLILPGPALMLDSLANNTAQLPAASGQIIQFPTNTNQSIVSGIAAAQAGAVIRQWWACINRYALAPVVYCTGGGLQIVESEIQNLLKLTQQAAGCKKQPAQTLLAPILDGLTYIALSANKN